MRAVANFICQFLSALALIAGLYFLFTAVLAPGNAAVDRLPAAQFTQVYAEASYLALVGIGLLITAAVFQLAVIVSNTERTERNSRYGNELLQWIGRGIYR